MARHFLQSTRPLVRAVRNNIEIVATLAAIAAGALVPLPSRTEGREGGRGGANVRLTAAPLAATDSLAFNLMR